MKILILNILVLISRSHGSPDSSVPHSDQVIFFYEILHRVEQPLTHEYWIKKGENLFVDKEYYTAWTEPMVRFYQASQQGKLLPKTAFYGSIVKSHHQQMLGLFHFLKNPPDWEIFVQNACWARQHVNPHMFVYAFTMAVLARSNKNGHHMPEIYEILPRHFYDENFVSSALEFNAESKRTNTTGDDASMNQTSALQNWEPWQWWKMLGLNCKYWYNVDEEVVQRNLPSALTAQKQTGWWRVADYTRDLLNHHNKDKTLSYLTEDSNWNAYWYNVNQLYSFPIEGYNLIWWNERLGEYWFYFLQQYLTRYNMERLSHGLGTIPAFNWDAPIKDGYDAKLNSLNGLKFSVRPNNWIPSRNHQSASYLKEVYDTLEYIKAAIRSGALLLRNGTEVNLRDPKSVIYICDQIRGHADPNGNYINSNWYSLALMYFADLTPSRPGQINTQAKPNVLLNFETMPRDPFFYVFHQEILNLKQSFESFLPPYRQDELHAKGIEVIDLRVSQMTTYDDIFDFDVTNLLRTNLSYKDGHILWKESLFARRARLNHKPFDLNMRIISDKIRDVLIRFYLAPKLDEFGRSIELAENRHYFLHLASEIWSLKLGENNITFSYNATFERRNEHTRSTYFQAKLYHVALDSMNKQYLNVFPEESKHCGLRGNLLLPRGHKDGLPMQLFVHVFDEDGEQDVLWWRPCRRRVHTQTLSYPFDRPIINAQDFLGSNMLLKDIKINHEDRFEHLRIYFQNSDQFPYEEFDNYGMINQ